MKNRAQVEKELRERVELRAVHRVTGRPHTFTRAWFDDEMKKPPMAKSDFLAACDRVALNDENFIPLDMMLEMCKVIWQVHNHEDKDVAWALFQIYTLPAQTEAQRPFEYRREEAIQ